MLQNIPMIREKLGVGKADRAILRAAHYFAENRRVCDMVEALRADDLPTFLQNVVESGASSAMYLQNIYASSDAQEVALALMLADQKLRGKGAWRIHGGGFAGTTLNFVPVRELDSFVAEMQGVFGERSCQVLDIRPEGAAAIDLFKESKA